MFRNNKKASNTMTAKPSPGALRAADKILELIEGTRSKEVNELRPATVEILAKHIDRETGAPDLLAALEQIVLSLRNPSKCTRTVMQHLIETTVEILEHEITKAKGESK